MTPQTPKPPLSAWLKWLKNWNEGPLSLLLLLAFVLAPVALHRMDARSGSFDLGYLHVLVLAGLLFYFAGFVSWTSFRLNFPLLYKEFTECLEEEISTNQDNPRTWRIFAFSLAIYFAYFCLVAALLAFVLFSVPR